MNKKGLSPVVATALLIVLAIILAAIIFLWARGFLIEKAQKKGSPIEYSCKDVKFEAEAYNQQIKIVNRGDIAIFSIEVKKKSTGTIEKVETLGGENGRTVRNGEDASISLVGTQINEGDEIVIAPIILGKKGTGTSSHICDEVAQTIVVEA